MADDSYMGGMPTLTQAFYTNEPGDFGSTVNQFDRATYGTAWHRLSKESRENMFNMWLADYNNQFNARQAELSYERQKELIAAENEYNSPVNQMARYAEAGLNPNVIYGQIQPGNQTQIAKYDPQRSSEFRAVGDPRGTKEQRLQQSMDILGMLGNMVKQITGMAQDVEGVKNASLQNELLAAQLPFEKRVAEDRLNIYKFLNYDPKTGVYVYGGDPVEGKPFWFDYLFPNFQSSRLSGSRADWQEWYNENIADPFKKIMTGRGNLLEAQTGEHNYDLNMLNQIPEQWRAPVYFILEIVRAFSGYVPKFSNKK